MSCLAAFVVKCRYAVSVQSLPWTFFDTHHAFWTSIIKMRYDIHSCLTIVITTKWYRTIKIEMIGLIVIDKLFEPPLPVISPDFWRIQRGTWVRALPIVWWIEAFSRTLPTVVGDTFFWSLCISLIRDIEPTVATRQMCGHTKT